jgi:radical SAM protein with 4Fe4S-binding SPASM domain
MVTVIKKPKIITFEVTRHCRFHCPHCRTATDADKTDDLTTDQCKKILKAVARFTKCTLVFSGGEPMERPDIYKLIRYTSSLRLTPILATCGYLINDKSIAELKRAHVSALAFSLDGASAHTHDFLRQSEGSFDQLLQAARIARLSHLPFQINTTITRYNFAEINAIAGLARQIGAASFNPFILVPADHTKNSSDLILDPVEYETLLNQLLLMKLKSPMKIKVTCGPSFARIISQSSAEKRLKITEGCMGGSESAFISFKGDLQTCPFLNISAGNIISENYDFAKIWKHSEFLNEIRDRSILAGRCATCDYRDICGGCRARAYSVCSDYLGSDPACSYNPREKT